MSGTGRGGNGSLAGLTSDELRAAVREVLKDALPALAGQVRDRVGGPPGTVGAGGEVVLRSDADLDSFVRRVAALCADEDVRSELAGGRHGFRLAGAAPVAAAAPAPGETAVLRVERGAVTERTVLRAARDGARLLIGRAAVLTPLARDRARSLGVPIEKEA